MQKSIANYIVSFFILVLLQVFLLNKIQISGYINPFLYVFFILILPFNIRGYALLLIAFFLGLTIDMFVDTPGVHTMATVLMAFIRPSVISLISIKKGFEAGAFPGLHNMDKSWIITYSLMLIFIHHTSLFFIEVFTFKEFFSTLWRSVLSTSVTFVLVLIAFLIESKPRGKK